MIECNHCFQEEFSGGPFKCQKCDQQAMVFPIPMSKLDDPRDASEAGEWNGSWLWHKMDTDETRQAGLVHYFEGVVTRLRQKIAAKHVLDIRRTIESCKRETKSASVKRQESFEDILNNIDLVL